MIYFTVCSNNYLGFAKTLCDSLNMRSFSGKVVIFICDRKRGDLDYEAFRDYRLVFLNELRVPNLDWMVSNYNIIELNTAIKPFAFSWCMENYPDDYFVFLDPDIFVTGEIGGCVKELGDGNILLTPHILEKVPSDDLTPREDLFTQYGIYNLGFLLLRRSAVTTQFLSWWSDRLSVNCFAQAHKGVYVDQLLMNFVPIFFEGVVISRNKGLNVAPWNIHERQLTVSDDSYVLKGGEPLIFYHFSNYELHNDRGRTHPAYSRHPVESDRVLSLLYQEYAMRLEGNDFRGYRRFAPAFGLQQGGATGYKGLGHFLRRKLNARVWR